jgi:predicted nucleotide-binding protein/phosphoserine phosphatase
MNLGVFIDVDQVITQEPINVSLARGLGPECEAEYRRLDDKYHQGLIAGPEQFNQIFVPMFRKYGFTKSRSEQLRSMVVMRPESLTLLRDKRFDLFLVSSGPSFIIEPLAELYKIPAGRVRCTQYDFDPNGELFWKGSASATDKGSFVRDRVKNYALTVGLGDNVANDQAFLEHCDIRIIVLPQGTSAVGHLPRDTASQYLTATELKPLLQLIDRLSGSSSPDLREGRHASVFVGSSSESGDIAYKFSQILESKADVKCHPWQGLGTPGQVFIDTLVSRIGRYDYAVLILSPDDETTKRGQKVWEPRDNVILELGMALAFLGKARTFGVVIVDSKKASKGFAALPSDLQGVTMSLLHTNPQGRFDDSAIASSVEGVYKAMLETMK